MELLPLRYESFLMEMQAPPRHSVVQGVECAAGWLYDLKMDLLFFVKEDLGRC